MKLGAIFLGTVHNGKLTLQNQRRFDALISSMDGMVEVLVRRKRNRRSNKQNKYYRAVPVAMLSEHLGYTREEMHDALRWLFLRVHHDRGPDTARSTTELTTVEFNTFISEIQVWAATEFSLSIPDPNEVEY